MTRRVGSLVLLALLEAANAGFGESTAEEKEAKQQRKKFNAEVRDLAQPLGISSLKSITQFGDDVAFFNGDDGVHGFELWRSDLAAEETKLVLDIHPGSEDSCERHARIRPSLRARTRTFRRARVVLRPRRSIRPDNPRWAALLFRGRRRPWAGAVGLRERPGCVALQRPQPGR